uniref:ARD n=1 Tax=Ditylenchus dipsaci TaxID=166011 RepID=A0A915DKH9_9BILA
MVQIWTMELFGDVRPYGDPRLPHHVFPPKTLNPDELTKKTGTLYYKLDLDDQVALGRRIAILKIERKFKREDTYTLDAQSTIDFQEKLTEMFEDTESKEDIARMILEGAAYYDVEATDGSWVRIMCEYGDLIVIPAGRMHRMSTTNKNFVKYSKIEDGQKAYTTLMAKLTGQERPLEDGDMSPSVPRSILIGNLVGRGWNGLSFGKPSRSQLTPELTSQCEVIFVAALFLLTRSGIPSRRLLNIIRLVVSPFHGTRQTVAIGGIKSLDKIEATGKANESAQKAATAKKNQSHPSISCCKYSPLFPFK